MNPSISRHTVINTALEKVNTKEFSLRKASLVYGIALATLSDAKNKKYSSHKRGPKFALSESTEKKITIMLTAMSDMGFGFSRKDVLHIIENYLVEIDQQDLFKHGRPSLIFFVNNILNF